MTSEEEQILRESIRKMVKEELKEGFLGLHTKNVYNNNIQKQVLSYIPYLMSFAIDEDIADYKDPNIRRNILVFLCEIEDEGKVRDFDKKMRGKAKFHNPDYDKWINNKQTNNKKPSVDTIGDFDWSSINGDTEPPKIKLPKFFVEQTINAINRLIAEELVKNTDAAKCVMDIINNILKNKDIWDRRQANKRPGHIISRKPLR